MNQVDLAVDGSRESEDVRDLGDTGCDQQVELGVGSGQSVDAAEKLSDSDELECVHDVP